MLGKKKSIVGLDIGSHEVKVVELTEIRDQLASGEGDAVAIGAELTEIAGSAATASVAPAPVGP